MFVTDSPFSHVCIAFWVDTPSGKRLMCVEAQERSRRRIFALSYYEGSEMTIIAAPKPWEDVRAAALMHVGQAQYGWLEAIYVGVRELIERKTRIKLPMRGFAREFCSAFVANIYQLDRRDVSPQALYEQLLGVSYIKEKVDSAF